MPSHPSQLSELLAAAKAGDSSANNQLAIYSRNFIRALSKGQLGSKLRRKIDSSDIIQNTQVEVFRSIENVRAEDTNGFFRYVRGVWNRVFNREIRDYHRQKRDLAKEVVDEDGVEPLADSALSPSRVMERDELISMCTKALETLTEVERITILRKDAEGVSLESIGRELGVSSKVVVRHLKQARRKLRFEMEQVLGTS